MPVIATPSPFPLFPLFADLAGRDVLVVGGGIVASRKVQALLEAGARVRVGAPALDPALAALAASGRIAHLPGRFDPAWLASAWLAFAATGDKAVNRAVADAGQLRGIWINVVDDAALCAFQVPARIRRGPLQVAISSGGEAPMAARALREWLEARLDPSWGTLATLLARFRLRIRRRFPEPATRRAFLSRAIDGDIGARLRRNDAAGARRALAGQLKASSRPEPGRVALVGAGPGDPGLLTLRGLRLLGEADVILHDRLVGDGVLALARLDAERIEVGKSAGGGTPQDRIHALMLEHARAGRRVVRLKGGDPFVFGRGGEELQFLRAHGIAYEVVPGVTAALACAAHAGIPLTHREHAQSLQVLTARTRDDEAQPDWTALAGTGQTLAVYMGVGRLQEWRDGLIGHGRDPRTPFALVENGSRPEQRVVVGPLAELCERARDHAVRSPALLVVGEVAALAHRLHWFGAAPLGAATVAGAAPDNCRRDAA